MATNEQILRAFVKGLVDNQPEPPPEDWRMDGKNEAIDATEDLTKIEIAADAKRCLDSLS